jgi:hypothetical protein
MADSIPELAEDLVELLFMNGAIDVSRAYNVVVESKSLTAPKVTVVPATLASTPVDRSGRQRKVIAFDCAYRVKASDLPNEIDGHIEAVAKLAESIAVGGKVGDATVIGVQINPVFSPEHLIEHSVFTSVIRVELSQ